MGFDTVNLHRPTSAACRYCAASALLLPGGVVVAIVLWGDAHPFLEVPTCCRPRPRPNIPIIYSTLAHFCSSCTAAPHRTRGSCVHARPRGCSLRPSVAPAPEPSGCEIASEWNSRASDLDRGGDTAGDSAGEGPNSADRAPLGEVLATREWRRVSVAPALCSEFAGARYTSRQTGSRQVFSTRMPRVK